MLRKEWLFDAIQFWLMLWVCRWQFDLFMYNSFYSFYILWNDMSNFFCNCYFSFSTFYNLIFSCWSSITYPISLISLTLEVERSSKREIKFWLSSCVIFFENGDFMLYFIGSVDNLAEFIILGWNLIASISFVSALIRLFRWLFCKCLYLFDGVYCVF